jgi:Tol biopolymer transport system component
MSVKQIQGGLYMLKHFPVFQKILGSIILLSVWNLLGEQAFADAPSGTIAFLSDRDLNRKLPIKADIAVYLIDADGFNETPWKVSNLEHGPIAWSPDGKSIAHHLQGPFTAHTFLETPVILPEHWEHLRKRPAPKGAAVVVDPPNSEFKNVTKHFGGHKYLSPKWSPDGKWLALTSTDGSPDGMTDVCVMDIQGNRLKNLTQWRREDEVGSWSPDGSKIVFFSKRDGNAEVYVMDSNGKNQVNLTNHPAFDTAPTWSPDGTRIAFHSNREGNQDDIYVMNPDGANVVNLTRHPWEDRAPAWSPNGR